MAELGDEKDDILIQTCNDNYVTIFDDYYVSGLKYNFLCIG